jgi:hypothetical protein
VLGDVLDVEDATSSSIVVPLVAGLQQGSNRVRDLPPPAVTDSHA